MKRKRLVIHDINTADSFHYTYKVIEKRFDNNSVVSIKKDAPTNYTCICCGTKAKHFASDCYALKLKCNKCSKVGHLSKVCKSKQRITSYNNYIEQDEEQDAAQFFTMNNVRPNLLTT